MHGARRCVRVWVCVCAFACLSLGFPNLSCPFLSPFPVNPFWLPAALQQWNDAACHVTEGRWTDVSMWVKVCLCLWVFKGCNWLKRSVCDRGADMSWHVYTVNSPAHKWEWKWEETGWRLCVWLAACVDGFDAHHFIKSLTSLTHTHTKLVTRLLRDKPHTHTSQVRRHRGVDINSCLTSVLFMAEVKNLIYRF